MYFNKKLPGRINLYIASGADPVLQISQSVHIADLRTLAATILRTICVLCGSGAFFTPEKFFDVGLQ